MCTWVGRAHRPQAASSSLSWCCWHRWLRPGSAVRPPEGPSPGWCWRVWRRGCSPPAASRPPPPSRSTPDTSWWRLVSCRIPPPGHMGRSCWCAPPDRAPRARSRSWRRSTTWKARTPSATPLPPVTWSPSTARSPIGRATIGGPPTLAIDVDSVELVAAASGPFFGPGNLLRRVVLHRLEQNDSDAATLVAGFLVGETDRLPDHRMDELRRAGLTHFVAVSGSNVALFLAAWWLIIGPFGLRSAPAGALRRGGVGGIRGGPPTREPSVVRAAAMAGVVLGGRIVGVPVEPWRALGLAVAGLLLVSGSLAVDVGFQLSVAATTGVLAAIELVPRRRPRWLWTALTVTVGAQIAVLPIILAHFDTVPLLSPVANLLSRAAGDGGHRARGDRGDHRDRSRARPRSHGGRRCAHRGIDGGGMARLRGPAASSSPVWRRSVSPSPGRCGRFSVSLPVPAWWRGVCRPRRRRSRPSCSSTSARGTPSSSAGLRTS